jgi:raffinose/stachyose/melibiose transport system substrate-binding protein
MPEGELNDLSDQRSVARQAPCADGWIIWRNEMRKLTLAAAALGAMAMMTGSALSETVVKWMHTEANPKIVTVWEKIVSDFEANNADIKIDMQFLENQAFKRKLTTLLQSDAKPHLFYSWGGGVFQEQAKAGVLRDISSFMDGQWGDSLSPAGVKAFKSGGKSYGAPFKVSQVGFWYNKELYKKADVDPSTIKTWDDFLAAMAKIKAAGITPIALGAGDQWPVHFYWAHLIIRLGGEQAILDAGTGANDGFKGPVFIKAGEMLKQLVDLEPFQKGFLSAKYGDASGVFGDAKAATHFQGTWDYNRQRSASVSKEGLSDDVLGWYPFPQIPGGTGDPSNTLGGINGWLVSKGAPDEAVQFLRHFTSRENQERLAEAGFMIPVAKGADSLIKNKFFGQISKNIATSSHHQLFLDQDLGPDVGRAFNDGSAGIAAGTMSAQEAAETVYGAWEANQ